MQTGESVPTVVMPAQAGIPLFATPQKLDPSLRWGDESREPRSPPSRHASESWYPASLLDQCRKSIDGVMQVVPVRVHRLDQADFPVPPPGLDLLLAPDRAVHAEAVLIPDKAIDAIARREPRRRAVLVGTDPRPQVAGHADVERPPVAARHDVDGGVLFNGHVAMLPRNTAKKKP